MDNNFINQINIFEEKLKTFCLPRFDELPDLGLYMDQVVGYVNKTFCLFDDEKANITPAMINNYVKNGIIPPPNGKKYGNVHLAYICVIYFLKKVLSMDEIKTAISYQTKIKNDLQAYNGFCDQLENAFKGCCYLKKQQEKTTLSTDPQAKLVLNPVTISIANLIYTQKVISLQAQIDRQAQEEKEQAQKEQKELIKQQEKEQKEFEKQEKKNKKKQKGE